MIASVIRFCLIQRPMILLLTGALVIGGLWAFRGLPIDAFPDISAPQVQVIVKAPISIATGSKRPSPYTLNT